MGAEWNPIPSRLERTSSNSKVGGLVKSNGWRELANLEQPPVGVPALAGIVAKGRYAYDGRLKKVHQQNKGREITRGLRIYVKSHVCT